MEPNNEPRCGATYSRRLAGKVFVCNVPPHPNKPDTHHYVASDDRIAMPGGNLIVMPGERR